MGTRIAVLSLAVAALVFSPALAADKAKPAPSSMMRGSIISVMDGKVSVLGKEGKKITTFKFGKDLEDRLQRQEMRLERPQKGSSRDRHV